jgi:hypothetical protein
MSHAVCCRTSCTLSPAILSLLAEPWDVILFNHIHTKIYASNIGYVFLLTTRLLSLLKYTSLHSFPFSSLTVVLSMRCEAPPPRPSSHYCHEAGGLMPSVGIVGCTQHISVIYFGPSGVRALPLAAGINVGGHYKWHFFLFFFFFLSSGLIANSPRRDCRRVLKFCMGS